MLVEKGLFQFPAKTMGKSVMTRKVETTHYLGLDARKPVFLGFANNKSADHPEHPCSLISAFVIGLLESIIIKTCSKRNFTTLASL